MTELKSAMLENSINILAESIVDATRRTHLSKLAALGLPSKKTEAYKFTPITAQLEKRFDGIIPAIITEKKPVVQKISWAKNHLVFVNGAYDAEQSEIADSFISISQTSQFQHANEEMNLDPFFHLNQALTPGHVEIKVKKGNEASSTIIYQIITVEAENKTVSPSISIKAEQGASIKIYEKTLIEANLPVFINRFFHTDTGQNSSINFTRLQQYDPETVEIDGSYHDQDRDSRFFINTYSFSGGLLRNNLLIRQNGENCETHMHGLCLIDEKSHVDNYTAIDHRFPNSYSNELYKSIVSDRATSVFNGRIFVRPGAQKTNAFQANSNIALSENAIIHTKPQLEIWADDVKCSHGCTIGQLDEEALFYLRARGLDEKSAKAMLLIAFSEASFEYIPFDPIKELLDELIQKKLGS